jgi:hypothetical protein
MDSAISIAMNVPHASVSQPIVFHMDSPPSRWTPGSPGDSILTAAPPTRDPAHSRYDTAMRLPLPVRP